MQVKPSFNSYPISFHRLKFSHFNVLSNIVDFEKSTHRHSHSLDLLAFYYSDLSTTITKERAISEKMTVTQLQVALPAIVVGLASPVQVFEHSILYVSTSFSHLF